MAYGYTLTAAGRTLLLQLQAGNSMTISRIAVGDGEVPDGTNPATLTGLVHEIERSQATCTTPIVEADTLSFEIEYRNKWDAGTFGDEYTDPTGLTESFWLKEYAVFALDANGNEIMLYYANLGDFPEPVARWNGRNLVSKRYPVSISIVDDDTDIQLAFPTRAFVTSEYLEERLSSLSGSLTTIESLLSIVRQDINKHTTGSIVSEAGIHGLRYYNGKVQIYDGGWIALNGVIIPGYSWDYIDAQDNTWQEYDDYNRTWQEIDSLIETEV